MKTPPVQTSRPSRWRACRTCAARRAGRSRCRSSDRARARGRTVGDELGLPNLRRGAELARRGAQLALWNPKERALEDAVVVARRAARAAGDECLADVLTSWSNLSRAAFGPSL